MHTRPALFRAVSVISLMFPLAANSGLAGEQTSEKRNSEILTITDIPYTNVHDTELKLDLMVPKEVKEPVPAVMIIQGGAWRGGNKRDCQFIMPEIVRHGYAAISPQYRFCPKEVFPAQVQDVKAAVRWVKLHAKEHNIDP
jgi:acetyl esterase/lipase